MSQKTRRFVAKATLAPLALLAVMACTSAGVRAQGTSPAPTVRLRGTLEAVGPASATLRLRAGGSVELALADKLVVSEVYPIALADIAPGSFIGTAARPQADGTLRAIAITVFPESARGTAEGHRPFDLTPESTMTNATVADVATIGADRRLVLRYKEGQQTLIVPPEVPVVTFKPATRALLVVGASVSLSAQEIDGKATALRVNAGRDGFQLPY